MKVELMRYRNDSIPFYMNILAIVFNAVYMILLLSNDLVKANFDGAWAPGGYLVGADILYNIVFMLFCFLAAEKTKAYLPKWFILPGILAVTQTIRIFASTLQFHSAGQLINGAFIASMIVLVLSVACLVVGSVVSYINSRKLRAYLKSLEEAKA